MLTVPYETRTCANDQCQKAFRTKESTPTKYCSTHCFNASSGRKASMIASAAGNRRVCPRCCSDRGMLPGQEGEPTVMIPAAVRDRVCIACAEFFWRGVCDLANARGTLDRMVADDHETLYLSSTPMPELPDWLLTPDMAAELAAEMACSVLSDPLESPLSTE